jgi:cystathionine beta-lyase/cystathionine gamma-synthase
MIDGTRIEHFKNVIRHNTRMIYLESPNSFMMELQDMKAVSELAKHHNILTIIDNSYSTPLFQNPSDYGIDIIVHSASKYLGGHSDLIAGVICADSKMIRRIFDKEYLTFGGIITPENAWLLLRGLRNLPVRLKQIQQTTYAVVKYLEQHPKIEKVIWPFSEHNPQLSLAMSQMKGAGGLFSFLLRTNSVEKADLFCDSLKHFLLACSWGGHESLVYPASVQSNSPNCNNWLPMKLIRMYVGLEEADYLISDIEKALELI